MELSDLTPKQLAEMMGQFDPKELASLPHALLYQARSYAEPDKQKDMAKYEHRAFAREVIEENPLMAASLPFAIPAYQLYKMGKTGSRSGFDPSQILQGYVGIGEGIKNYLTK